MKIKPKINKWGLIKSTSFCPAKETINKMGRSAGKGIGYPLQYSWASLVAQLVKNLPAMWETPFCFPGSGRSAGERIGFPFQYSWASLVAQVVKNLPAMLETWV